MLSNSITAYCTQYIDYSEKISYNEFEDKEILVKNEIEYGGLVYSSNRTTSQSATVSAVIKTPFLIVFVRKTPGFLGKVTTVLFVGTKVDVKPSTENFCLVESKSGVEGYVFKGWVDRKDNNNKLKFNRTHDCVYIGGTNADTSTDDPRSQVKYNGSETVSYSTDDTNIISVDSKTGLVTGKKAGTANLIARVGTRKVSIPVYCIYKWKKEWTGKANKSTTIYSGTSNSTSSVATISSGTNFYVKGDDGGSAGWAYGYANVSGEQRWGFVKINDISTKGTVSFYNNLGWKWPLKDSSINFISSPYAPRSDSTSTTIHHRGMDLTTGVSGEISGKSVVVAYDGVVKNIRANVDSCGHCISISSDSIDLVTEERIAMIYMHLQSAPKYSNGKLVKRGDTVSAGTEIGKVGNTNGNTNSSMGYHLHFETNNKNAGVGDSGRSNFDNTINPIYFYKNKEITLSTICEAYSKGYGAYWYAYNS